MRCGRIVADVELRVVKNAQNLVITVLVSLAIAGRDFKDCAAIAICQRRQMISEQGKAIDIPIVFNRRNCRL